MRSLASAVIVATALLVSAVTFSAHPPARSLTAVLSPTPSASPSASRFPWQTLPRPGVPAPFEPFGPPLAAVTEHGIRVELWLSSASVAPGTWIQALVRATNVGTNTAWWWPGTCSGSTAVRVDLAPVIAPGVTQTGDAAVLKRRAVHDAGVMVASFASRASLLDAGGTAVAPWAECTTPGEVAPLAPGASIDEAFAWYPAGSLGEPLPPGAVQVTVRWPFSARGRKPHVTWSEGPWQDISVRAPVELTGPDPLTPSVPELIDSALADPRFRDWVEARPDTHGWWVAAGMTSGPSWIGPERWAAIVDRVPHGAFEIMLAQDAPGSKDHIGVAILDPWTGEVIDVVFMEDF